MRNGSAPQESIGSPCRLAGSFLVYHSQEEGRAHPLANLSRPAKERECPPSQRPLCERLRFSTSRHATAPRHFQKLWLLEGGGILTQSGTD